MRANALVLGGSAAPILLWMLGAVTLANSASSAPEPERSQLVDLNVVVFDSHNQPVTDLAAADFQVVDAGKAQQIIFFRRNQWVPSARLGPREFSNRPAGAPQPATVILFDVLNDTMGASSIAAETLIRTLEKLESGGGTYLYFLTRGRSRLYPVRPLPGEDASPAVGTENWNKDARPVVERAMNATFAVRPAGIDIVTQVNLTLDALSSIAGRLGAMPGRKNIVWITHGVPAVIHDTNGGVIDYTPQLRRLSDAMVRVNVAIYPVQQTPRGTGRTDNRQGYDTAETLDLLAQLTGGREVADDVSLTLHQAVNDIRSNYEIGYQPPPGNWDGKFHKLRVTCSRKGVRVQSRTAYFAIAEPPGDPLWKINAIALNPVDAGEIGIRVAAEPFPNRPHTVRLTARIDAGDIAMVREGDAYTADLRVAVLRYDSNGSQEPGPLKPLDLHFTAAELDQALQNGIPYSATVELNQMTRQVLLIVLDNRLGVAGSVTMAAGRLLQP